MSTTFDVFPSTPYIPTFEEAIALAEVKLQKFFTKLNLDIQLKINVDLHTRKPDIAIPTALESKAQWSKDYYAWFTVNSVAGGTDAYFHDLNKEEANSREISQQIKLETLQKRPKADQDESLIEGCLKQEHEWGFRRSAGQPGMIAVTYGFIASAFAELTHGLIYSDDGAWDSERMPALSSEFDDWYMRPELAIEKEYAEWAERCIDNIEGDFSII